MSEPSFENHLEVTVAEWGLVLKGEEAKEWTEKKDIAGSKSRMCKSPDATEYQASQMLRF